METANVVITLPTLSRTKLWRVVVGEGALSVRYISIDRSLFLPYLAYSSEQLVRSDHPI
jgi:hypothetical protein